MFENQKNRKDRLYKHLIELIKNQKIDYSQAEIKSNILNYGVKLNNKLNFNQLEWIYPEIDEIIFSHWPARSKSDFSKIQIVFEDSDTLVINKPKGLVVETGTGNLYNNILHHFNTLHNTEYYSVHRLDKDTSGLLILAKSEKARDFYQDQFRSRTVKKKYLTVVEGELAKVTQITSYQVKDKINPIRQKFFWYEEDARNYDSNYRLAHSVFYPLVYCEELNLTLIEVQIHTGRMHQIRLQLESLGNAVNQDIVYNLEPVSQLHSSVKPTIIKIVLQKKHGLEYKKQLIKGAVDNSNIRPELIEILPIEPVKNFYKNEFNSLRTTIFGDLSYGLISNYLSFKLMSGQDFSTTLSNSITKNPDEKNNP